MTVHDFPKADQPKPDATEAPLRARLAEYALAAPPPNQSAEAYGGRRVRELVAALVHPRAVLEAAAHLSPGAALGLHFERGARGWRFDFSASGADAHAETAAFQALQRRVAPQVRFAKSSRKAVTAPCLRLAPRATVVGSVDDRPLWLPPPDFAGADLTLALRLAFDLGVDSLTINVRPHVLSDEARAALAAAYYRLAAPGAASMADEGCRAFIADWLNAGRGCALDVDVALSRPLEGAEIEALSTALFGVSRGPAAPPNGLDMRTSFPSGALPSWRFWPIAADLRRYARAETDIPAGGGAITLGLDAADQPVRMKADDRTRHTYVLGATGAGKSNFICNAVREDIENGEGVMLIDPHGDLAEAIYDMVPQRRRKDVIWIDLGDDTLDWRLDLFHLAGVFPAAERNRIANQMIALFRQIYAGNPEAFGPAFEMFFRAAMLLLLTARDQDDRTIVKFETVLANKAFRNKLLGECNDEMVVSTWKDVIEQVDGDWKLANMAPYITCKLNQLSGNPLTRRFISGDKPRLDLRRAMDKRKIVLVNLNKGVIGGLDARFIGALLLMALIEAAMGRCRTPVRKRTPFRFYCDEFQLLATEMAAELLAECRKYGLSAVFANQSLGQLGGDWYVSRRIDHALLGNCGTFVVFRTGSEDAQRMAALLNVEDSSEFTQLGVGEMLVRRLGEGLPLPVQRLTGLPPPTRRRPR